VFVPVSWENLVERRGFKCALEDLALLRFSDLSSDFVFPSVASEGWRGRQLEPPINRQQIIARSCEQPLSRERRGAIVQKTPREQASLKRKWIDFLRQWLTATQNFTQAGSAALDLDKSRDEALNIIEDEMAHA
jgi:hypothetical protein